MGKIKILIGLFLLLFVQLNLQGQVTVSGAHSSSNGTYSTLQSAFTALNGQSQTGNTIEITLTASTTETASAVLNEGTWTSLSIYPAVSGVSISGNITAPLIDFNGADNVTIDGRVNATGSDKSLNIQNINISTDAGNSTVRFINGACNNIIKYSYIKGSSISYVPDIDGNPILSGGIIFFSTTSNSNGNSGNTIDNNDITNAGGNRPIYALYSDGTIDVPNSNNTISGNNFYDFINPNESGAVAGTSSALDVLVNASVQTGALMLASNNNSWLITGNSFYETTNIQSGMDIRIMVILSGNNYTVSGNYFGGNSPACAGNWLSSDINSYFTCLHLFSNSGVINGIQGNTIKNISLTEINMFYWLGIYIESGDVNIGTITGNTIGSTTGNGSINILSSSSYISALSCIGIESTGIVNVENNNIGSITVSNTSTTGPFNFYGIIKGILIPAAGSVSSLAGTITISKNKIGSNNTLNSINSNYPSTGSAQVVYGIY